MRVDVFHKEHGRRPVDFDPFAGPLIERTSPTTEAQREIWTAAQLGREASCAYNESVSLELVGGLDVDALVKALHAAVERHEAMRMVMSASGTRAIVFQAQRVPVDRLDLKGLDPVTREQELEAIGVSDMTEPFDLSNGPLFRFKIIHLSADKSVLRITGHHLVCDGWSLGILMADISRLYTAFHRGKEAPLGDIHRYSDYAAQVLQNAHGPEHERVERFWLERFAPPLPRLDLPTDHPRPRVRTFEGDRFDLVVDPELVRALRRTATRAGASFVTTLLTAFEVWLHRITGCSDLVVGLPAAGQSDMGMKELVGHCVNLLALRSSISPERSFLEHLRERRSQVLDAFDHQRYTFGTLLGKLKVPREAGRIPLVPVVFNVDMNMDDGVAFDGLQHRFTSNPRAYENFELFLNATGKEDHLVLEWSYNRGLFERATIERWAHAFAGLLDRIARGAEGTIGALSSTDTHPVALELPPDLNGKATPYPRSSSINALFDAVCGAHGDRTALVLGDMRMSYAALHARVNTLATELRAIGVAPGEPVGLCVERGPDMVVAMLAVLRCGGCFVPFDPSYPAERLNFMFADTRCKLLLTQRGLAGKLPAHTARVFLLDDQRPAGQAQCPDKGSADGAAYIMYTSGSTGTPKGVVVPHRAIARLVRDQNFLPFGPEQVFLQLSNISFDASTLEIWGALLNGGTLVLQPQQRPTLQEIAAEITAHDVSVVWFTAGLFNLMVDQHLDALKGVRHVLAGGDVLSVPHVRKALRALGPGVLINGYGPTENTTFTCCHVVMSEDRIRNGVPVGRPIANTTVHILDEQMRPVPIGGEGELYTGGDGLALGYHGRPDLTAERFVADPVNPEGRLYRTGDLARWAPDGAVEFIGRSDGQVKVRGFRIELGEVEARLDGHPAVKDRVVVVREDREGYKQLTAYVVPHGDAATDGVASAALIDSLRQHLRASLPEHMVPTGFAVLEALPLTPNGKVDRRALPAPDMGEQRPRTRHVAPRSPEEADIASIWQRLLRVDQVGVNDDFFDLGGHSMLGIELLAALEERFERSISLKELVESPTVAGLAALVSGREVEQQRFSNLTAIQPKGRKIPFFCVHGDEINRFLPRRLGGDQPYFGFAHQGEDGRPMRYTRVEALAAHFIAEMRMVRPKGPYLLGGYSFGGTVAFEMARQLTAQGEQVPLLMLFDTYAPHVHAEAVAQDATLFHPLKSALMRGAAGIFHAMGRPLPGKLRHFHIIDTYDRATVAYRPSPYTGPITLFQAQKAWGGKDKGWGGLAIGDLRIFPIPGDHFSLVKEPDVNILVEAAVDCLAQVQETQAVDAI